MRFLRRSLVGIFLLAITVGLLAFAGNTVRQAVQTRMNAEPRSFPQRERVFAVNVVEVQPQTIAPVLTVFGEVDSSRTLQVRSAVGGTIVETAPELVEGGVVRAGQLLLRVDPTTALTQLERLEVDLQDAKAELLDAQRALELAHEELISSQGQYDLRLQALTRVNDMSARGVGTAAAVEAAELALASAEASVLSRRQSLASAEARLELARTRLARTEIGLKDAQRAVGETEVYAVFSGTLANVSVSNGGRLSPNEQIATLLDPTDLEVAFRVSTSQYSQLLDGTGQLIDSTVTVGLDLNRQGLNTSGKIIRESAAVGEGQTGRLLFAKLDTVGGMRPGDFVTVQVRRPTLDGVALVPTSAVSTDNQVLVVGEENRLELAEIQVLHRQGDEVLIRVGELAGKSIVAQRSPLLGVGIRVRPILPGGFSEESEQPETLALDNERRAKLLKFVEESRMPAEVKERLKSQLAQDRVPAAVITRLESQMGS